MEKRGGEGKKGKSGEGVVVKERVGGRRRENEQHLELVREESGRVDPPGPNEDQETPRVEQG